jgi:hypothetical protein
MLWLLICLFLLVPELQATPTESVTINLGVLPEIFPHQDTALISALNGIPLDGSTLAVDLFFQGWDWSNIDAPWRYSFYTNIHLHTTPGLVVPPFQPYGYVPAPGYYIDSQGNSISRNNIVTYGTSGPNPADPFLYVLMIEFHESSSEIAGLHFEIPLPDLPGSEITNAVIDTALVPEPSSFSLVVIGLIGMFVLKSAASAANMRSPE